MSELEQTIMETLDERGIPYDVIEHDPVYTNPEMAEQLGIPASQTIKNLVLVTNDKTVVQVLLPGDKRFDAKKVAKQIGVKKLSFAKPETVLEVVGCPIGCVPPFGQLTPIQVHIDPQLMWNKEVYFNPGVHHKSVKVETVHLKELCQSTGA